MRRGQASTNPGFTIVELLVVITLLTFILLVAYRIFFSQAKTITQSIEFIQVNESFRKISMYLGNDVREATQIILPRPINLEAIDSVSTKPGVVLQLFKKEIDPSRDFAATMGQVAVLREVIYELEAAPRPQAPNVPRYRLIRTEYTQVKPGEKEKQRREIVDNLRDFMLFRTIRKPMKPRNVNKLGERSLEPEPHHLNGTGDGLLHLRVVLERARDHEGHGDVYQIALMTSFYKRGREVFPNQ
jgi:prepilin-type N-terminal cleavage/methylation domain-containing protein